MTTGETDNQSTLDKPISVLFRALWAEALEGIWRLIRKVVQDKVCRSLYEVLEYESALTLRDRAPRRAYEE
jgi:hypothetical protein